jgi:sigma-B regulation protein RsbU (phosphoserine phosphatase)
MKSERVAITLEDRLQQMMLLQHAAHKINSILDLDTLLDAIVGDVAQTFGCSRSAVLLKDDLTNELELVAVRGWSDDIHPKGFRFKIDGEGIVGQAALSMEPIYAPNVKDNPDWARTGQLDDYVIPLRVGSIHAVKLWQ